MTTLNITVSKLCSSLLSHLVGQHVLFCFGDTLYSQPVMPFVLH